MFEMVSFHTDTGLKPLSPLIDGPINDCPKSDHTSTRCCFSSLMSCVRFWSTWVLKTAPNSVIDRI